MRYARRLETSDDSSSTAAATLAIQYRSQRIDCTCARPAWHEWQRKGAAPLALSVTDASLDAEIVYQHPVAQTGFDGIFACRALRRGLTSAHKYSRAPQPVPHCRPLARGPPCRPAPSHTPHRALQQPWTHPKPPRCATRAERVPRGCSSPYSTPSTPLTPPLPSSRRRPSSRPPKRDLKRRKCWLACVGRRGQRRRRLSTAALRLPAQPATRARCRPAPATPTPTAMPAMMRQAGRVNCGSCRQAAAATPSDGAACRKLRVQSAGWQQCRAVASATHLHLARAVQQARREAAARSGRAAPGGGVARAQQRPARARRCRRRPRWPPPLQPRRPAAARRATASLLPLTTWLRMNIHHPRTAKKLILFVGQRDAASGRWAFRLHPQLCWADVSPDTRQRLRHLPAEAQQAFARKYPGRPPADWRLKSQRYKPPGSSQNASGAA